MEWRQWKEPSEDEISATVEKIAVQNQISVSLKKQQLRLKHEVTRHKMYF